MVVLVLAIPLFCGCTKDEVRAKTAEWIQLAKEKYAEAYAIAEIKYAEMLKEAKAKEVVK
jgi:hypothetical protein